MYLAISLLGLRAGFGIWLYQFLINAYLFTFHIFADLDTLLSDLSFYWVYPSEKQKQQQQQKKKKKKKNLFIHYFL